MESADPDDVGLSEMEDLTNRPSASQNAEEMESDEEGERVEEKMDATDDA